QELSKEEKQRLRKEKKLQKKKDRSVATAEPEKTPTAAPTSDSQWQQQKGAISPGLPGMPPNAMCSLTSPYDTTWGLGEGPAVPAPGDGPINNEKPPSGKSKAELRAERRAKQETDRSTKQTKKGDPSHLAGVGKSKTVTSEAQSVYTVLAESLEYMHPIVKIELFQKLAERFSVPHLRQSHQAKLLKFQHLYRYSYKLYRCHLIAIAALQPVILRNLASPSLRKRANCMCVCFFLYFFQESATSMVVGFKNQLLQGIVNQDQVVFRFLNQCRPLSASMGNAIKSIKKEISSIPSNKKEDKAKHELQEWIDKYVQEKIHLAAQAISRSAYEKIIDGDVILVYGCSSLVNCILCDAHERGRKFRVVVVDSRPRLEGREALRRLVRKGIHCTYIMISAVSYILTEVSKVFLGAHALLANGYVMSRVGTSQIALVAKAYNVPVLVCCETYKFCERVQTDSFVSNELDDPDDLIVTRKGITQLAEWQTSSTGSNTFLHLLNLVYDVTPPDFVDLVITELGMIPCSSVPVVLRVKNVEQ
uniref:Translation initiation factor eIF2B subunit delta n=1 Tax=Latimeria chalumnae TaxID=7897 RepID=H2ZT33_LATCH